MNVRKSLAIAFAVTGAVPSFAADWSGPFVGISGGYGAGQQSQSGGVLQLPSRGGRRPASGTSTTTSTMSSSTMTSSTMTTPPPTTTTGAPSSICFPVGDSSICVPAGEGAGDGRNNLSGGLIGGGVGYNWQLDHFVYGLEADGSWADISGDGTCGFGAVPQHSCGGGIKALGTVRGNIGYDLPFRMGFTGARIFAAGGLAIADVKAWDAFLGNSGSKTIAGWTVGGGLEVLLSQHWSLRLEYLHVDLGDHAIFTAIPPNPERVRTTAEIGRIGLSYHFNAPVAAPIVARY